MATLKVAPISKKKIKIEWTTNINGLKTVHIAVSYTHLTLPTNREV